MKPATPLKGAKKGAKTARRKATRQVPPTMALELTDFQLHAVVPGGAVLSQSLESGTIESGTILSEGKLAAAAKQLAAKLSATARRGAAVVLPTSMFAVHVTQVSGNDETQVRELLKHNLKTYVPELEPDALVDFIIRPSERGGYNVTAITAERATLRPVYTALAAAGITIRSIEPRVMAELRAAHAEISGSTSTLVLHMEATGSYLLGINAGRILIAENLAEIERMLVNSNHAPNAKSFFRSLTDEPQLIEGAGEALTSAIDEVTEFYRPLGLPVPDRIVVTGSATDDGRLAHIVGEMLFKEALTYNGGRAAKLQSTAARLTPRDASGGTYDVTLGDTSLAPRREGPALGRLKFIVPAALLTVSAGVVAYAMVQHRGELGRQDRLSAERTALEQDVATQRRLDTENRVIEGVLAKQPQLENLRENWPAMVDMIASRVPSDGRIGITSITGEDGKNADARLFDNQTPAAVFQIQAEARSQADAVAFLRAFETEPFSVSLSGLQQNNDGVTFTALIGIASIPSGATP